MKTPLLISLFAFSAHAETLPTLTTDTPHELWLTTGFISHHFQTDQHLRNNNAGVGLEYRYSNNSSAMAGRFNNSDWQSTNYLAWHYQPLHYGVASVGAVVGLMNGYPRVNNSGWFVTIIPAISVEYQRFGANLAVVPTIHERVYGAISLQLKFKLY